MTSAGHVTHNQASVAPDGWAPRVAISCGDDVSSLGGGWRRLGRHGLGSVLRERERRDDDIRQPLEKCVITR